MKRNLVGNLLLIIFGCLALSYMAQAAICPGCVELDDLIFNKTIARFPYALVKFDIAFPYGEKHEAYSAFSQAAHAVTDDLLIAAVGIKDYGDNENKELGESYNIDDKNFPGILLFRHGVEDYIRFPSHLDITVDNLKSFVTTNTNLFIGKEGCLKDYNDLAKNFVNLDEKEQQQRLSKADEMKKSLKKDSDKTSAQFYKMFMQKLMEKGYGYVEEETKRLLRLKAGKVSAAKKHELAIKLNILESFRVNILTKEEL
ncbi:endoplasmic reticulum protein 29-like protein wbl [Haematobia irritans]|uniref:endoplasmic reticulum protein 29-like protein wbl n=1 Tax=Haematobia irritans TaxID=7368 RepID=UPI003F4F92E8